MDDILFDTNVFSELVKPRPDPNVIAFLREVVNAWICSITLHELVYGAERAPDPKRRAKLLAWIAQITAEFAERTIEVDSVVAEHSGRLRALAAAQGSARNRRRRHHRSFGGSPRADTGDPQHERLRAVRVSCFQSMA